ncbi:hypothetical protein [Pseudarthrobacter sp. S6]|uniref:hypothetical protein n=1 Tax=Pseudarthrobacter sp. S6 TaxID=3418420 RepID=UPI003CF56C14
MSGKTCEECRGRYIPSRTSQRFCSTRCANRQRDRRRRRHTPQGRQPLRCQVPPHGAAPDSSNAPAAPGPAGKQELDNVLGQLRSQATDIDRLEAENADQRATIRSLGADVVRLHTVQQTGAQDLLHIAGKLLALTRAVGVELDNSTKQLFRRRGWSSASRNPQAAQP